MTKINWDDKPLGLIPDQALAGMLGVSISTVRDQRILRGIMSSTDMVRQECMTDPEFLTANAKDLAAKYGVSFVSVYAWRRKGGNASLQRPTRNWRAISFPETRVWAKSGILLLPGSLGSHG